MASRIHVPVSTTQGTPPSLPSSAGFLPIRAPITVDDFQSDGYKTDTSDSDIGSSRSGTGSNIDNGFVSGEEEFDSASERPFLGDPDEENSEEGDFGGMYRVSRPFVADPDEENSVLEEVEEEESGVTDEFIPVVGLGSANSNGVRPIAQLSMDDDEFDKVTGDEGMVSEVDYGSFSGVVKVPSFGAQEIVDVAPLVKVLDIEEDKEDGLLVQSNSSFDDNKSSLSTERDFGADSCVLGPKDAVVTNGSANDSGSVKLVEDNGHVVTVTHPTNLWVNGDSPENSEGDKMEDVRESNTNSSGIKDEANGDSETKGGQKGLLSPENFEGDQMEDVRESNTNSSGIKDEANRDSETIGGQKGLLSDDDIEELIFGGSGTTKLIMNELEQNSPFSSTPGIEAYHDHPQTIDGEITMDSDEDTDSDEEADVVRDPVGKQLFDSAAFAALLKAATGAELDGGRIALSSVDGSGLFSLENPAGSGFQFRTRRHAPPPDMVKRTLSEEEKKILEKIQHLRVKFLRLVQRLGQSPEDSIVESVLHRLDPDEGRRVSREFSLETAKSMAMQLEAEGKDDLNFSVNILVLGKTGVGKSATINSIFGEKRVEINAFAPATTRVNELVGTVDGVKIRIIDTPGLRSSVKEEATNRKILASVKKLINKFPPDVVLYVDRLDTHDRDRNDLLLLSSLSRTLTSSIWKNAIVTLTHATSPPPDGPSGSSLAFEVYVAQRSHVIQQAISQAVGDSYLMHPSMKHPVSLVENHSLCQKNENGENVLPNGQSWRPQLLLLCYSLKVLSEASSISKPQDLIDHKKPFGLRLRSLPLPHLVSSLLHSRPHLKLPTDLVDEDIDSDMDLVDLPDSDAEDEDEYDQLPPFKPLRKSQVQKLSKEQKKAYFEEYDYRVKLLQKKQWRDNLKRLKEIKKRGKDCSNDIGEDVDQEDEGPAPVPVPLPDFVLPQSFDSDNPSYRYRALEPASQFLVRPVLDAQGWDHDCGYDGVNIESNLAIAGRFPGAFTVQITKDKKDFNIQLDSSICAKHGENGSTMVGFDIQTIGRQLAYILRSETKLKKFKMNKSSAGISVTLLGENVVTGFKIEDQIAVGKRLALVGNAGTVRSGNDTAYGANFEVRLKSKDFPIEQDQSTLGLSLMKWRGDLGLMAHLQSQFSIGWNSKMAVHVGMNNKRSGQISIKTSSSELQAALIGIVPIAVSILQSIYPGSKAGRTNILDH
ncbi:PREDICTED: translocase of chloroplast 159, chloroplastic-like [Populus euphratica]|uniref:Translocase of chloroplast 159, chloroplastic-like n=1 Tax=Populus euphratica TaxID=75702 RepID=A0AAJ6T6D9_POPEU|nr:PREDICTED: translocase of chloroplast 159, chloroplastic-like [Populus euphratica]